MSVFLIVSCFGTLLVRVRTKRNATNKTIRNSNKCPKKNNSCLVNAQDLSYNTITVAVDRALRGKIRRSQYLSDFQFA